jgi:phage-related minor tail protein
MRIRGVIAISAAAVVLGGCGGGNGGGEEMTADEFRQQADAICAEFEGRLDDLGRPESLDDLQNFVSEAVPIIEEGNAQLQELNPPDELQEQWDRAMKINNEQLETVRDLREAVEDGDQAHVQELIEAGNEANTEADQLAADLGLEDCGSD